MKCIVSGFVGNQTNEDKLIAQIGFYTDDVITDGTIVAVYIDGLENTEDFIAATHTAILAYANSSPQNYGITENDIVWVQRPDHAQVHIVAGTVAGGAGAVAIDITSLSLSEIDAVIWEANDDTALYSFGTKADSITEVSCVVKKQATASTNALINLLGGLTSVVTGVSQSAAPNGTSVRAIVIGK